MALGSMFQFVSPNILVIRVQVNMLNITQKANASLFIKMEKTWIGKDTKMMLKDVLWPSTLQPENIVEIHSK